MQNPIQLIGRAILGLFSEVGRLAVFAGRVKGAAFTPRWYGGEILRQIVRIGFYSLPVVGSKIQPTEVVFLFLIPALIRGLIKYLTLQPVW